MLVRGADAWIRKLAFCGTVTLISPVSTFTRKTS
jgi:hypothetical protein